MKTKTLTLLVVACAAALVAAPAAMAQQTATWKGMDNEFGKIRAPYTVDMNGQRAPVQAQVVINEDFKEKDGRFYMFILDVQHTPMDVDLEQIVRTDTGEALPCYQQQDDKMGTDYVKVTKCTVDGTYMPPEGTEILITGSVGSANTGTFNVGVIALPFTATWGKIPMSNGLDAELYAGTAVNVVSATHGSGQLAGLGNKIPAAGALATVGAMLAAVALGVALRGGNRRS